MLRGADRIEAQLAFVVTRPVLLYSSQPGLCPAAIREGGAEVLSTVSSPFCDQLALAPFSMEEVANHPRHVVHVVRREGSVIETSRWLGRRVCAPARVRRSKLRDLGHQIPKPPPPHCSVDILGDGLRGIEEHVEYPSFVCGHCACTDEGPSDAPGRGDHSRGRAVDDSPDGGLSREELAVGRVMAPLQLVGRSPLLPPSQSPKLDGLSVCIEGDIDSTTFGIGGIHHGLVQFSSGGGRDLVGHRRSAAAEVRIAHANTLDIVGHAFPRCRPSNVRNIDSSLLEDLYPARPLLHGFKARLEDRHRPSSASDRPRAEHFGRSG